jgi:hypothetical protein
MEWGALLKAFMILAIPFVAFLVLLTLTNRPKFRKGDKVIYEEYGVKGRGTILTHDQQLARHWAIERQDGEIVWVYEGYIGKL